MSNLQTPERKALSVVEAARAVGISGATVYRLLQQRRLRAIKIGARTLIPVAELDNLLEKAAAK
jgi:excisionase family DNA binding protein